MVSARLDGRDWLVAGFAVFEFGLLRELSDEAGLRDFGADLLCRGGVGAIGSGRWVRSKVCSALRRRASSSLFLVSAATRAV